MSDEQKTQGIVQDVDSEGFRTFCGMEGGEIRIAMSPRSEGMVIMLKVMAEPYPLDDALVESVILTISPLELVEFAAELTKHAFTVDPALKQMMVDKARQQQAQQEPVSRVWRPGMPQ